MEKLKKLQQIPTKDLVLKICEEVMHYPSHDTYKLIVELMKYLIEKRLDLKRKNRRNGKSESITDELYWIKCTIDVLPHLLGSLVKSTMDKKGSQTKKINAILPDFLYKENNKIKIGAKGDSDVTEEWNSFMDYIQDAKQLSRVIATPQ